MPPAKPNKPAIRFGLPRLGDMIEGALKSVGITEQRVAGWLGHPCGCKERRAKLNALSDWVNRKLGLSDDEALKELEDLTTLPKEETSK